MLDPAPFLPPHNVRFRRGNAENGECAASECGLIATDFWKAGYGRVQVVPSVQVSHLPRLSFENVLRMLAGVYETFGATNKRRVGQAETTTRVDRGDTAVGEG